MTFSRYSRVFFGILIASPIVAFAGQCPDWPSTASAVNAKQFKAAGDGVQDDTAALQAAVDATPAGGTLFIPAGNYLVAVDRAPNKGIALKSNMTLVIDPHATLKAMPTKEGTYSVLKVWNASNVQVWGGTLAGERDQHQGTGGEWGMGIDIRDSSHVKIFGTVARDTWGDGFYLGGKTNSDVQFCGVIADHNRRNGLSIVAGDGVSIVGSRFVNTAGTPPQAGVDVEPDANQSTQNITIDSSVFLNNVGQGIAFTTSCEKCGAVNRNNVARGNTIKGSQSDGIRVSYDAQRIENNTIEDSGGHGILLWRATGATVQGNKVRRSAKSGVQFEGSSHNIVQGNTLEGNAQPMLFKWQSNENTVTLNSCTAGNPALVPEAGNSTNTVGGNSGCR